jgi:hypothetical protein
MSAIPVVPYVVMSSSLSVRGCKVHIPKGIRDSAFSFLSGRTLADVTVPDGAGDHGNSMLDKGLKKKKKRIKNRARVLPSLAHW